VYKRQTIYLDGMHGDCSETVGVGAIDDASRQLIAVTRDCLTAGIAAVKPGGMVRDIGRAIAGLAEPQGYGVVRAFVGHGIGFDFHEPPQVPHFGRKGDGLTLIPGMVFTIEPMINLGRKELRILEDGWTAVTRDGSLSAQFEQTLLVTADGHESLTPFDL